MDSINTSKIVVTLVGAHGTGKTTLVKELQNELQKRGMKCVETPELPRIVCDLVGDKEYFRREANSLHKQLLLLIGQPILEHSSDGAANVVVCDRSILDHYAYTINGFQEELAKNELRTVIDELVKRHCEFYDLVFYVPIEFAPEDDGTREDDVKFQQDIDRQIKDLLRQFQIEHFAISGTVSHRAETILDQISSFQKEEK